MASPGFWRRSSTRPTLITTYGLDFTSIQRHSIWRRQRSAATRPLITLAGLGVEQLDRRNRAVRRKNHLSSSVSTSPMILVVS